MKADVLDAEDRVGVREEHRTEADHAIETGTVNAQCGIDQRRARVERARGKDRVPADGDGPDFGNDGEDGQLSARRKDRHERDRARNRARRDAEAHRNVREQRRGEHQPGDERDSAHAIDQRRGEHGEHEREKEPQAHVRGEAEDDVRHARRRMPVRDDQKDEERGGDEEDLFPASRVEKKRQPRCDPQDAREAGDRLRPRRTPPREDPRLHQQRLHCRTCSYRNDCGMASAIATSIGSARRMPTIAAAANLGNARAYITSA